MISEVFHELAAAKERGSVKKDGSKEGERGAGNKQIILVVIGIQKVLMKKEAQQ